MRPVRLRYAFELLDAYGAFDDSDSLLVEPRAATAEEVMWYHTPEYVQAVRALSDGDRSVNPADHNFGPGDNPAYEGIFDASALSTGAALVAVEMLVAGEVDAAFSISGGLHHAMPNYAYGFCVFNDPVIAIKRLLAEGMRVAYIDIDCHHGDGVQYAFYDTDQVLTISLHESGAFLFPGTGFTQETGAGLGRGHAVNLPLFPYTTDEVFLWAFREVVPRLLDAFRPDVLVTQLGIDTHYLDPLTHMALTVQGFAEAVAELSKLAPRKWLALGGGGYDLHAVARAWTLAYGVISQQEFPTDIPESYRNAYGVESLPDPDDPPLDTSPIKDARNFAEASVQSVQRLIFPTHGISAV
jgi:acetoin utilization protein AcuC